MLVFIPTRGMREAIRICSGCGGGATCEFYLNISGICGKRTPLLRGLNPFELALEFKSSQLTAHSEGFVFA